MKSLKQFAFCVVLAVLAFHGDSLRGQSIQWTTQDSFLIDRYHPSGVSYITMAYRRIVCFDSSHILALGGSINEFSLARVTLDEGVTWHTTFRDSLDFALGEKSAIRLWDAVYLDSLTILMTADSGNVYRSVDGGLSWSRIRTSVAANLMSISMRDRNLGVCYGTSNNLLITRDAGESWTKLTLPQEGLIDKLYLTDADFTEDSVLIISMAWAGDCRRYRSTDLGESWVASEQPCLVPRMVMGKGNRIWSIGGIFTGYREYRRDILEVSDDSGQLWRTILNDSIDPAGGLNDVAFSDAVHGIAVGVLGKVLVTNNGGEHWQNESLSSIWAPNITSVIYPTANKAWAVTVTGQILKGERLSTGVNRTTGSDKNSPPRIVRRGEDYQLRLYVPNGAITSVLVVDLLGREVIRLENIDLPSGVQLIPLQTSELPTGWYYIDLHSASQRAGIPLIVQ